MELAIAIGTAVVFAVGAVMGRFSAQGEISSMHRSVDQANHLTDKLLQDLHAKDAIIEKMVAKNMSMVKLGFINTQTELEEPMEPWGLNDADEARIEQQRLGNGGPAAS